MPHESLMDSPSRDSQGVPCAQAHHCSATAEFWYDFEEGHIEVAHQDLHLERVDLPPKPVPVSFELLHEVPGIVILSG